MRPLDRSIREGSTEQANHGGVRDSCDAVFILFSLTGLGCAAIKAGDVSPYSKDKRC
jgi:hypothetical protein